MTGSGAALWWLSYCQNVFGEYAWMNLAKPPGQPRGGMKRHRPPGSVLRGSCTRLCDLYVMLLMPRLDV